MGVFLPFPAAGSVAPGLGLVEIAFEGGEAWKLKDEETWEISLVPVPNLYIVRQAHALGVVLAESGFRVGHDRFPESVDSPYRLN